MEWPYYRADWGNTLQASRRQPDICRNDVIIPEKAEVYACGKKRVANQLLMIIRLVRFGIKRWLAKDLPDEADKEGYEGYLAN
jgi:hypothetical protein